MNIRFNHAFEIAFEVKGSKCPEGTDVTEKMLVDALQDRIKNISHERNWKEVAGSPFDTYEYDISDQLLADAMLNVEALEDVYNQDGTGEYPEAMLNRATWRNEVARENTTSGYWQWVSDKLGQLAE